jgi:putative flippase GtrA
MKRRFRRFLLVGALITAADLSLLIALGIWWQKNWYLASVVSLVLAAALSFLMHRRVTFNDDVYSLIDHQPMAFIKAVTPALVADYLVFTGLVLLVNPSIFGIAAIKTGSVMTASFVRFFTYRRVLFAAVRQEQMQLSVPEEILQHEKELSIVIPAFQAELVIGETIKKIREATSKYDAEIIVVDDGSDDLTSVEARKAGANLVITLDKNHGKGAAVRAGMLAAAGRFCIFTDADLAYPAKQILSVAEELEKGWDIVVGNRRHPDSHQIVQTSTLREVGSLCFNILTWFVLLGGYRDTQCGLKGFSSLAAEKIFTRSIIDGFGFDVEMFHLGERLHLTLKEIPVVVENGQDTTVQLLSDATRMLRDVFVVRRLSALGSYHLSKVDDE